MFMPGTQLRTEQLEMIVSSSPPPNHTNTAAVGPPTWDMVGVVGALLRWLLSGRQELVEEI